MMNMHFFLMENTNAYQQSFYSIDKFVSLEPDSIQPLQRYLKSKFLLMYLSTFVSKTLYQIVNFWKLKKIQSS